jgi:hypothetical protein
LVSRILHLMRIALLNILSCSNVAFGDKTLVSQTMIKFVNAEGNLLITDFFSKVYYVIVMNPPGRMKKCTQVPVASTLDGKLYPEVNIRALIC